MSLHSSSSFRMQDLWDAAVARPRLWLIPVAVCSVLAALYGTFRTPLWEAAQAMVVRDETSGSSLRPGKFTHADDMKTVQETILELAKSRDVLRKALVNVGAPEGAAALAWPLDRNVEDLSDDLRVIPPKGAEFGKTEMFYVAVRGASRPRAVALAAIVSRELQTSYEDLRAAKAGGVVNELQKTVQLAQRDLEDSTAALARMETEAGVDLGDLRLLNELSGGESGLRKMLGEISSELRVQLANQSASRELRSVLQDAQSDPGRLVACPSKLFDSQPALKRLKEGLVDAELRTAQLQGSMSNAHPLVIAARAAEEQVAGHLHSELANASRGLEVELRMTDERIAQLGSQQRAVETRMQKLTGMRAEYANVQAAVKHRTDILKTAQTELSEARANQAAAKTASLITLVGSPETGSRPAGIGTLSCIFVGAIGGLALGLGWLVLVVTAPADESSSSASDSAVAAPSGDFTQSVWQTPGEKTLKAVLRKLASGQTGHS